MRPCDIAHITRLHLGRGIEPDQRVHGAECDRTQAKACEVMRAAMDVIDQAETLFLASIGLVAL